MKMDLRGVMLIATLCHAANAAYCHSIGDDSQVPWEQAPDWQKDSAINGVNFRLANPDAPDSASHDSWMAEKVAAGWVYGETKDATKKTHPCIVPFDQLPPQQQFKDALFGTIVKYAAPLVEAGDEAGLSEITAQLDRAADAAASAQKGRDEAVEALTKLQTDYDEIAKQRDDLTVKLAAATKVTNVTKAAKPPKPRAAGPLSAKADRFDAADLFARLQDGSFTIVFSDGKSEIAIAPLSVTGNAWARMPAGVMLRDPQTIKADVAVNLAGFALFDSDGTQLGWSELMRPQRIHAGQEVKLDRQIVF